MYKCDKCDKEFLKYTSLCSHKARHVKRSGLEILKNRERMFKIKRENISNYLKNPEKCTQCNVIIEYDRYLQKSADRRKELKSGKTKYNFFCSSSCAATYNNTHKTTGNRKSKLELYLEEKLKIIYSNIDIHFNRKDAINSELDIYIPSLKLAFELNGIFHYEPIYGAEKLTQIKNNDERKFQACLENNIELCIIDSSSMKKFKECNAKPYLDIICKLINQKINKSP